MLLRRDRVMLSIHIMLDVAFHAGTISTVSASDIAARVNMARRGIEPLLQILARAHLLESTRGPKGGYKLGRPVRDIALIDILTALSSEELANENESKDPLFQKVVMPFWLSLDQKICEDLNKTTLGDLLRLAEKNGLVRPIEEPITFSI